MGCSKKERPFNFLSSYFLTLFWLGLPAWQFNPIKRPFVVAFFIGEIIGSVPFNLSLGF